MSRRLVKERIISTVERYGSMPPGLIVINREDYPMLPPLNDESGQQFVDKLIEDIGGVDFVFFDNIEALLIGDHAKNEAWQPMLPWVRDLTKRSIGQLWFHHTGHEETHAYGDKSREWQFDTVGHMIAPEAPNPERLIEFRLEFPKARERTPKNRSDFDNVNIWLDEDQGWQSDRGHILRSMPRRPTRTPTPQRLDEKFYDALVNALTSPQAQPTPQSANRKATTFDQWRQACVQMGLLDQAPHTARTLFAKHRRQLIALGWIACNDPFVWVTKSGSPLADPVKSIFKQPRAEN
jgi:hypothetical protein